MATTSLRARVEALEAEVARLKAQLGEQPGPGQAWWKEIWGSFADDPAFLEATRLGREYRESQRPQRKSNKRRS